MVILQIITLSVKVGNGVAREVMNLDVLEGILNNALKYVLRSPIVKVSHTNLAEQLQVDASSIKKE